MKKIKIIIFVLLSLNLLNLIYANEDLLPLQGKVYHANGSIIENGNLSILIYDSHLGGELIYNSSNEFYGKIINSQYDILLGSGNNNLSLIFGNIYYLDMIVNGENIDFDGNDRQMFQSSVGKITRTSSSNQVSSDYSFAAGNRANILLDYIFGINLNNSPQNFSQENSFSVMGGNSGFGTTEPKRTVHINDVLRLEPRNTSPQNASLGDMYVNGISNEICFFNSNIWKGLNGRTCTFAVMSLESALNNSIYLMESRGLHINDTGLVLEIKEVINDSAVLINYQNKYIDDKSTLVFLNETFSYKNEYLPFIKIIDIIKSNHGLPGFLEIEAIDINGENMQDNNTLFLGEGARDTFNISGTEHNIWINVVFSDSVLITIDNETRIMDIFDTYDFNSSYNWTLNNITRAKGEWGRYYINITRE